MPRNAKRVQSSTTAPGQAYGVAGDQKQAMQAIPLPGTPSAAAPGADLGAPGQTPVVASAPPSQVVPPTAPAPTPLVPPPSEAAAAAAMPAALATSMPALPLDRPTDRPTEPVTTLPAAPPPRPSPTAQALALLARNNGGDQLLQQIAARAAQRGG